jgi:excisionase family DNA binding protein
VLPRLLGIEAAARYLGVSPWTVRDLVAAGQLKPVRLSLPSGKAVRRLLFDRLQLDLLVESS